MVLLVNILNNSTEKSNHIVNSFNQDENTLFYYQGGISNQLIIQIGHKIKKQLKHQGQKVYNIFMELAQNILLYSQEYNLENGEITSYVGAFILKENNNFFEITFGNLIKAEDALYLADKIEEFNKFSYEELRKYRVAKLQKKGKSVGLGLVKVLLTSGLQLTPSFIKVNENYIYYLLQVRINKYQDGKLRN